MNNSALEKLVTFSSEDESDDLINSEIASVPQQFAHHLSPAFSRKRNELHEIQTMSPLKGISNAVISTSPEKLPEVPKTPELNSKGYLLL